MLEFLALLVSTAVTSILARAILPAGQEVFQAPATITGYIDDSNQDNSNLVNSSRQFDFAEWCRDSKARFLDALRNGGADEWVMVMGNEAAGEFSL